MHGPSETRQALARRRGIKADVSIGKPKTIGRRIAILVLVSLERERADVVDRFKWSIRQTPEVMNGLYVTGDPTSSSS